MHEITQQRIDESDLKIAKTFQNVGISKNTSIVFVAMLQLNKPDITQNDINVISGLPQGVVSNGMKELANRNWITTNDTIPLKGRGRPTKLYKAVSIGIIVKDLIDSLKLYNEEVKANIAKIKETYK